MPRPKHEISREKLIAYAEEGLTLTEIAKIEGRGIEVIRSRYNEANLPYFKKTEQKERAKTEKERCNENDSPNYMLVSKECRALALGVWV